jgi:predicted nucleic acid-binding protein
VGERWVVNASPLITLARAGGAAWLHRLAEAVVVPEAVRDEIAAGSRDPAQELLAAGAFRIVSTPAPQAILAAWDLGPGETAVLAFAQAEPGWTAILDDRDARRCAAVLGVPVRGTLGIVVLARQMGLTTSAAQVLRTMRSNGFRLDDSTIERVLREAVDETWAP